MKQTTKIAAIVLIVALLIIAVGYAAMSNITLTVTEKIKATGSQENFKVHFTGTPVVTTEGKSKDNITVDAKPVTDGSITAEISAEGLTTIGDTVTAVYTIKNSSAENVQANLTLGSASADNLTYFEVTSSLGEKVKLAPGDTTTFTVVVKLKATPVGDISTTVTAEVIATPESTAGQNN